MKNKILLFFPRLESSKPSHWFPMGTLAIAAALLTESFEVEILDERLNPDYDEQLKAQLDDNCLLVGVTAFTGFQLTCAVQFARKVRALRPDLKLIWGGPHVTALPRQSTESSLVDASIEGYGEVCFTELCKKLRAGEHPGAIDGLYWKEADGTITSSPPKTNYKFLINAPPMPYHLIDLPKYINPVTKSVAYITSYGCPSKCTFCHTPTRRWTRFSFEKIRADLEYLTDRLQLDRLVMYDATFFVDEDFCLDFINWQIEQKRFKSWICDGRAMDIERFSDKTLELAVKSGLKCVVVGLESGSEKIAKLHNKEHDHVNRYRRAITRLKDYDVDIRSGVIFGTPTETVDDLKASLDFIVEMTTVNPRLSCSTTTLGALPATELYNLIRKERGEIFPQTLEGWAEESDKTHYYYNSLNPEFPWIDQNIVPEYKKVYHDFWKDHTHLWR